MSEPLDAALSYIKRGIPVFPLHSPENGSCSCLKSDCDSIGKHPRTAKGFKDASTNEKTIRYWWTKWPDANIGIPTGTASGIVVIDRDSAEAEQRVDEIVGDAVNSEAAPETETGRGSHSFFANPDVPLRSRNGILEKVDFKAEAGYVVVPPSRHRNGRIYRWKRELTETLPPLPTAILDLLQKDGKHNPEYGKRVNTAKVLDGVPDGERNVTLYRLACKFVRAEIPESFAEELILEAARNCIPPLPDRIALEKIRSAYAKYQPPQTDNFTSDHIKDLLEVNRSREINAGELQRDARENPNPLLNYLPLLGEEGFIVKEWSHLIASYPRAGKTELISRIIGEWPEERVLYFTEEADVLWKARLKDLPVGYDHVTMVYALGMSNGEIIKRIQSGQETIIIIDTVRNILAIKDETDNSEVARVINPIIAATRLNHKTFIAVHHSRKGGGQNGEGITGGHAFMGVVDIALEITRDGKDESRRRILRGWGRVIEVRKLMYELGADKKMVALGSPAQVTLGEVKQRAFQLLSEEWQETKKIMDGLNPKPSDDQLTKALTNLAVENLAERDPPLLSGKRQGKAYKWRKVQNFSSDAPLYRSEVKFDDSMSGEAH